LKYQDMPMRLALGTAFALVLASAPDGPAPSTRRKSPMFASAFNISRTLAGAAGTLLFAGLCVGAATAPAAAHTTMDLNPAGQRVATVSHADLDLGSNAGRAVLETRVRAAARKVCANAAPNPAAAAYEFQCIAQAVRASRNATIAAANAARTIG
jgi:UrcA family protein